MKSTDTKREGTSFFSQFAREMADAPDELAAWKKVHRHLLQAVLLAKEAVIAQEAQKRFWLEEIHSNLDADGRLTATSVWKVPQAGDAIKKTKKPLKRKEIDETAEPKAAKKPKTTVVAKATETGWTASSSSPFTYHEPELSAEGRRALVLAGSRPPSTEQVPQEYRVLAARTFGGRAAEEAKLHPELQLLELQRLQTAQAQAVQAQQTSLFGSFPSYFYPPGYMPPGGPPFPPNSNNPRPP